MNIMFTIVKNHKEANAITHAGSFHADDVFASVFLSKLFDIKLYRTNEINEVENIQDKIVYDIGGGEFDHHDKLAKVRLNGIKYSSFGLLFEKFGPKYLQQKQIEKVDDCYQAFLKEFVIQIDAVDNGFFPPNHKEYITKTLDDVIGLFNKTWQEEVDNDEMFYKAFLVAEQIFDRIEKRVVDKLAAKQKVDEAISESKTHILWILYLPVHPLMLVQFILRFFHPIEEVIIFVPLNELLVVTKIVLIFQLSGVVRRKKN